MTSAWKPPCRWGNAAIWARHVWTTTAKIQLPTGWRETDWWIQYRPSEFWPYTETGVIYCFERPVRCLPLLLIPIQHALVSFRYGLVSWGLQKPHHSSQNRESRVLLQAHLTDSYSGAGSYHVLQLTVTQEDTYEICIPEHWARTNPYNQCQRYERLFQISNKWWTKLKLSRDEALNISPDIEDAGDKEGDPHQELTCKVI